MSRTVERNEALRAHSLNQMALERLSERLLAPPLTPVGRVPTYIMLLPD